MFEQIKNIHDLLQCEGIEDPLSETLRLLNIISGGAISNIDARFLNPSCLNITEVVKKRKENIPLEYIINKAVFANLVFECSSDTLVPTECTKLLVEVAMNIIEERQKTKKDQTIIEVGTGCGNIAVLLGLYTDGVKIFASDISPEAVEVARRNIDNYNLNDDISLFCGDLFSPFSDQQFQAGIDLVICNPPYLPTRSINKLSLETVNFQPKIALNGGSYGISFYMRLVTESLPILKHGGSLIFEIGERQEKLVTRILSQHRDYQDIKYYKDGDGHIRVISVSKNGTS